MYPVIRLDHAPCRRPPPVPTVPDVWNGKQVVACERGGRWMRLYLEGGELVLLTGRRATVERMGGRRVVA